MARILSEKPESSFAPTHSFCGCMTIWRVTTGTFEGSDGVFGRHSENFGVQVGTGSKTRGDQSQKCDEKGVAHREGYGRTNGRKLCVFSLDGVFGAVMAGFFGKPPAGQ